MVPAEQQLEPAHNVPIEGPVIPIAVESELEDVFGGNTHQEL